MDSLRGFMSGELAGQSRTVGYVPRPAGKGNQRLHAVWRCWFRTSDWCNQILSAYMKITFQMVWSIINPFLLVLCTILIFCNTGFLIFMSRNQQDKKEKLNDLIFFFFISTPVYSISDTFFYICIHISLTTNLEGGLQLQQDGLAEEDLPGLQAQSTDLILLQLHILARLCPSDCSMRTQTASATTMVQRCSR